MKSKCFNSAQSLAAALIVGGSFFAAKPAMASFFEVCDVTVKIAAVDELSVFDKGSVSVPEGLNQNGKALYSFVRLVTLEVLDAQAQGGHTNCQELVGKPHRVVVDSIDLLSKIAVGDELKMTQSRNNALTPKGVAYGETWKLK